MMASLPLLPGYTFQDINIKDYKLPHKLDILNGFPVIRDINYGIGRRPTDAASVRYAECPDPVIYDPSLTYGRIPRYAYRQFVPHHALYAQRCLRFKAFFRQAVFDSIEQYHVHYVDIIYYLEDDTLCVIEPVVENSGFRQSKLVRRDRIPKNDKGDLFIWKDFNIGIDVCIYGVVYRIVDCDPFTKEFLTSQGVDVGDKEDLPVDPYMMQRDAKRRIATGIPRTAGDDPRRRFLEYDGMVLSFDATWNDDRYRIMYFLTDDTVAIREIHGRNNGKDPVMMLLKRMRVPKNWQCLPSWHPSIYMEYGDPEVVEYYTPQDFKLGETILLFGRSFLLHDCDDFTRKYYSDVLGTPQPSTIPIAARAAKPASSKYVKSSSSSSSSCARLGGTEEMTYVSFPPYVREPTKTDVIRRLVNFPKKLRYSMRMDVVHPEDEGRNFVLDYSLSDGSMRINEIERSNSGRREGCFLSSRPIPKSRNARCGDAEYYYTPQDFFVGARINVLNHRFVITGADLSVYRYVEANRDKFRQQVRDNLRDYFLQQGMLQDDVDEEARKIRETEDERQPLVNDSIAIDDANKCTDDSDAADRKESSDLIQA